jgi:hypothetical protein
MKGEADASPFAAFAKTAGRGKEQALHPTARRAIKKFFF